LDKQSFKGSMRIFASISNADAASLHSIIKALFDKYLPELVRLFFVVVFVLWFFFVSNISLCA